MKSLSVVAGCDYEHRSEAPPPALAQLITVLGMGGQTHFGIAGRNAMKKSNVYTACAGVVIVLIFLASLGASDLVYALTWNSFWSGFACVSVFIVSLFVFLLLMGLQKSQ